MLDINFLPHPLVGTPFGVALDVCIVLAIACYLLALITREYSWVDRLWSICPPVYCLIVAVETGFESPRINLMTFLVVIWGIRLTYNFAIKGGYSKGGEDYRWAVVRERMSPVMLQVFNATFLAPGQMLLIWAFTAPIHFAWLNQDVPLNWLDYLAALVFLVAFVGETVADWQMWVFQEDKMKKIAAGEPVEQQFLTTGLYQYSRHPNYFCELAIWWSFYLFAISSSGAMLNWTGIGVVLLTLLFLSSTRLAETISLSKYPEYAAYQADKPRLIPFTRIGRIRSS